MQQKASKKHLSLSLYYNEKNTEHPVNINDFFSS
jgi:hypothetical protein